MIFQRTALHLAAAAATAAAAALLVFSCGFALYAVAAPLLGAAGGAAVVALISGLIVAIAAYVASRRAEAAKREHEDVRQTTAMQGLASHLGHIVKDRPVLSIVLAAAGGMLLVRNPDFLRDLIAVLAQPSDDKPGGKKD